MVEIPAKEIRLTPAAKEELPSLKVDLIRSFGKLCVGQYGIDGVDLIRRRFC